jgi:hypothetical protein
MKEMQTPDAAAVRDRVAVEPRGEQLPNRDHPVLSSCLVGDQNVGCGQFVNYCHEVTAPGVRWRPRTANRSAAGASSLFNAQFVTKHATA